LSDFLTALADRRETDHLAPIGDDMSATWRRMPWRQQVMHWIGKALNMQMICKEGWCFGAEWENCRKR
jgi:hypothetical protein